MTPPADTTFSVVIVGAGPAGLAAATEAAGHGAKVALVDAGTQPGGQYWRRPNEASSAAGKLDYLHHDLTSYTTLVDKLSEHRKSGAVTYLPQHDAWTVEGTDAGFVVHLVDRSRRPEKRVSVTGRRLVVATGAYDRQIPFPGWDLPGVMTAGGAQALLKGHGVRAGERVLVAGTGPFLLPVAAGLAEAGAHVVGVHEANSPLRWIRHSPAVAKNLGKLGEGVGYARSLARHRVPVRTRSMLVSVEGSGQVESATVARLDGRGTPIPGSSTRVPVDTVAVGWGFTPQLELLVMLGCETDVDIDGSVICTVDGRQETTVPGVFTAGETCGVGGAALSLAEGTIAGIAAAGGAVAASAKVVRQRSKLRSFAAAMHLAHPVPGCWVDMIEDHTVICRCEEVNGAELRAAVDDLGAADARSAKLLVRPGMGWCQGRVCGFATACLTAAWTATPYSPGTTARRPIATPVRLGTFLEPSDVVDAPTTDGAQCDRPTIRARARYDDA
ncbi:MAG TPA: NAD(P)/FAD-dependent oxidoreductase [Nocardioidaceae bacterium]|nr:NAD(P)/FAD-dependent oxidoreductase [Nocardioidaceae bacterium]